MPTFEPTLLVGIALVVLAVAVLAYCLGKWKGLEEGKDRWIKVPKTIHEVVKEKCVAAASAPSGELVRKTEILIDEVEKRIGRVLSFGGPCDEAFSAVKTAREGKPRIEEKKPAPPQAGAHDKPGHTGHDDHGKEHGEHGHDPAGHDHEPPLRPANVTILGGQTLVLTSARPPAPPAHPPAVEEPKPLEHQVYMQELRMAVVKFSDFWHRPECLDDLKACQKQLTETAKSEKPPVI